MSNDQRPTLKARVTKRLARPVAAVLLFTGCFHYVPAQVPPLPQPQTEIRVTLSEPWSIPMGEFTLHDVTRVEGIVAETSGDTLGMVARWLFPRVGNKYDALYASYNIPVASIGQLEEWRFWGRRTAIAVAVSAVVTTFVLNAVWRVVRGQGPPDGEPPAQSVRAPR